MTGGQMILVNSSTSNLPTGGRWDSGSAPNTISDTYVHIGSCGENAWAPGKWNIFQELEIRDLEREHCTRIEERVTQRHSFIQILRATIIPGHGRVLVQVGFHTFCPDAPNVGAVTHFLSYGAHCPVIWNVRKRRDRGVIAIFHIAPRDRVRCTRLPGRGNVVERHAPLKPLEWVKQTDDSGIFLKRQQSPRNRGMNI
ncbi:hypothetical protein TNCT_699921 [Trichonephila clavata]|uniref:Uncharacterized protein n=1 Tax=Trichonephila clavata TaxID=2740835 RepID=A0A8X6G0J1_TRICU|nr:hypothetical protein TNCT_699921 [Trichonephila clavata]